jgi:hypothetical protein
VASKAQDGPMPNSCSTVRHCPSVLQLFPLIRYSAAIPHRALLCSTPRPAEEWSVALKPTITTTALLSSSSLGQLFALRVFSFHLPYSRLIPSTYPSSRSLSRWTRGDRIPTLHPFHLHHSHHSQKLGLGHPPRHSLHPPTPANSTSHLPTGIDTSTSTPEGATRLGPQP